MKITEETRGQSYNEVLGNLGERQFKVYEALSRGKEQDYTARELALEMYTDGKLITPERNMVHPRLNELVNVGLVEVIGKRKDNVMNRNVAIYKCVKEFHK